MDNNPNPKAPFSLPGGRPALIATILLLSQAAVFYGFSRGEKLPSARPLDQFPQMLGTWKMAQQGVIEPEIKDVLKADDYINRFYVDTKTNQAAHLFVAFFKSQRAGQAPHSPKNCLPGAGWIWTISDTIPVKVASRPDPIVVNRYMVQKGDEKSMVLYWYQSRERVVADEYRAKVFVVADALRYNRTDTSLVRVYVPMERQTSQSATDTASRFVQAFFEPLSEFLPK